MCTLTIFKSSGRLVVTMSRDEQRNRPDEIKPFLWDHPKIFAPQDTKANGTWIGVNEKHEVAALLNGYQEKDDQQGQQSRGEIIPRILSGQKINPVDYSSFHLIYIRNNKIKYSFWGGKNFEEKILPNQEWIFFTSSSYKQDDVKKARYDDFERWRQNINFIESLPSLHLQYSRNQKAHSILMERDDACTKSITQFELLGQDAICRYWANPHINHEFEEYVSLF